MNERIEMPIYAKIALDIAGRIYHEEFKENERIKGRSTLAGEYNVSPETIRRAVNLLEDMKVVSVSHGKGIKVLSKKNAFSFLDRFQDKENLLTLKKELIEMMKQKMEIESKMLKVLDKFIDYTARLKHSNVFNPIEYEIGPESRLIGKTINETKFWQNTGATIIGIRRDGYLILSPGPYAAFQEKDIILLIGEMGVLDRIKKLYG
jgi:K+/H+ antiporter YhaU regulatory subunit KhtT